jgi:Flp pilus assembly protein CpaB
MLGLIAGGLLKEAVDDLEWPGGSVVLKLTRDPAAISMVARGTGSLEVSIRSAALEVYVCVVACQQLLQPSATCSSGQHGGTRQRLAPAYTLSTRFHEL